MPSNSSRSISADRRFDLQTKQNSKELHDKLSNIFERFEETRQAIKENVKMLENMADPTGNIDSANRTATNTMDSTSSYPSELGRRGRSISSTRLSSMDMGNTTGSNYGLRTISSVDSGVMLTLTSCSENGTQSRSRSFGSWTGTTSPIFHTRGDSLDQGNDSRQDMQDITDQSDDSEDDVEVIASCSSNDSECGDGGRVYESTHTQLQTDTQSENSRCRQNRRTVQPLSSDGEDALSFDGDRFETQEHFILFEEEEADIYHRLSSPSLVHQSPAFPVRSQSGNLSQSSKGDNSSVHSSSSQLSRGRTTCIVLPAIERVKSQSSRHQTPLNNKSHLHFQDAWVERDRFCVSKRHPADSRPTIPKSSNNVSANQHINNNILTNQYSNNTSSSNQGSRVNLSHHENEAHHPEYDRNSSRISFSPIPEECSSDLTSSPYTRLHRRDNKQRVFNPSRIVTSSDTDYSGIGIQARGRHSAPSKKFAPLTPLTLAALHAHSLQEEAQQRETAQVYEDNQSRKLKKYRHKRKKVSSPAKVHPVGNRSPLASSTSSTSSVPGAIGTPKSDAVSMSSYRNAIDRNGILLPRIQELIDRRGADSSSSSPSYYDLIYTSSSTSSASSCSDSEYDQQVHLLHGNGGKKHLWRSQPNINSISQQVASPPQLTRPKPPVIRKMSKEKTNTKSRLPNESKDLKGESQKNRIFKKNSASPKLAAKQKLLKSKSDEASHSLLRYFRFPSPPRTTEDNSDSSHAEKKIRSKVRSKIVQTQQCFGADNLGYVGGCGLESGSSECSCATSTTSDTASEIAYPDLKPTRSRSKLPSSSLTTAKRPSANAQPNNQPNSQKTGGQIIPKSISTQTGQEPATSGSAQGPLIAQSKPSTQASPLGHALPTAQTRPMGHTPPISQHSELSAMSSYIGGYTLRSPEDPISGSKKKSVSIFSCLFRKSKQKKEQSTPELRKRDPKLMLDLVGGEVRVKPLENELHRSRHVGMAYEGILPGEISPHIPRYSDYSPIENLEFNEHIIRQQTPVKSLPVKTYQPSPVYIVPVTSSEHVPSTNQHRLEYAVQDYPAEGGYGQHRRRYRYAQPESMAYYSPNLVYANDLPRPGQGQVIRQLKTPQRVRAAAPARQHLVANHVIHPQPSAKHQQLVYPPYGQQGTPYGQQGVPYGQQGTPYSQQGTPYGQQGTRRRRRVYQIL